MPTGIGQSSDPVNNWVAKHAGVDLKGALDSNQLRDLGSSSCKWYEKVRVTFRESNSSQWYQSRAEQLLEKHNTETIKAVLRQEPYSCTEERINEITSFLIEHHSISKNQIVNRNSLEKKLNLIIEFKEQIEKPWMKELLDTDAIDKMLVDDSPNGIEKMWRIVEVSQAVEQSTSHLVKAKATEIFHVLAMTATFTDESVKVIKEFVRLSENLSNPEQDKMLDAVKTLFYDEHSSPITTQFMQDVGKYNGLRQMVHQLDPNMIRHPDFPSVVKNLVAEWPPLLDLPDEIFANWVQNQIPSLKSTGDLAALPERFREAQVQRLMDLDATRMAAHYKRNLNAENMAEMGQIVSLLSPAKMQLEDLGLKETYKQLVEKEGAPSDVAASAATYASEISQVAQRYRAIDESAAFISILKDKENGQEPLPSLQNEFHLRQWRKVKEAYPKPIQDQVEAAINTGSHHKEAATLQRYLAAIKPGGTLDRFKQFLGTDELTNVVTGVVVENTESGETLLGQLVELRSAYQRYQLDKQFLAKANAYFSRNEVKNLSDTEKLTGFLTQQGRVQTELRSLDQLRNAQFNQPGMDKIFDQYTGALIAEKMKDQKSLFSEVLKQIHTQYNKSIANDMDQIKIYQEQLVDRLVPANTSEEARAPTRAIVEENMIKSLTEMAEKLPLDQALTKLRQGLEVSIREGRIDIDALNAVKALRGAYYAGQYQIYTEKMNLINPQAYNTADEEVQLHMMAAAFAQDINQQLGATVLTPQFVAAYIQRPTPATIPDPISFQMMRLHEALRPFFQDKQSGAPKIPVNLLNPTDFQTFLADWENIAFAPASNKPLMALDRELYVAYQTANQKGLLTAFMNELGRSSIVLESIRASGAAGTRSRESLLNIGAYYRDYAGKSTYSPEILARAMRTMVEQTKDLKTLADGLGGLTKKYEVSTYGFSNTEQRLHLQAFRTWAQEQAAPGMTTRTGGQEFLNTLIKQFRGNADRIPDEAELIYASRLIRFATERFREGGDPELIITQLREFELTLNLAEIRPISNLELKLSTIEKTLEKRAINHSKVTQTLQQNPLHAGTVLLPVLVEQLLPANERGRLADLKTQLADLEEKAQDIVAIKGFGSMAGGAYLLASDFLTRANKNNASINEIRTNLLEIAQAKVSGTPPEQPVRSSKVTNKIVSLLNSAIGKFIEGAKNAQPTSQLRIDRMPYEYQVSSITSRLADKNLSAEERDELRKELIEAESILNDNFAYSPLTESLINVLPTIVRYAGKLIQGASYLPSLLSGFGFARKGLVRTAQPIINKILERYMPKMTPTERQIIVTGISPILEILFLAGPSLLKNHNIKVYADYLEKLNLMIQSPEPLDAEQLQKDTWALVAQFLQEAETYTDALEATILALPDLYET